MDKKVMAIVIVVAAVAIIGCVLLATHKDGSKCDYTLLDSSDNVKVDWPIHPYAQGLIGQ